MSSIRKAIRDEVVSLLPAVLFFFAAFNLIILTEDLAMEEYKVKVFHFASAAVAALLIAKVIFLVNYLPFINTSSNRPLIYRTLWKTLVYVLAALLLLYIEHLIPPWIRYGSLADANRHLLRVFVWSRFAAILIWLAVLFFIFTASQELALAVGKDQLRRLFFGR